MVDSLETKARQEEIIQCIKNENPSLDAHSRWFGAFGTNAQVIPVTTISATTMGCKTFTPALAAISPISEGKRAPPACATTKIMPVGFY
jgi:hypothetical protein